MRVIFAGIFAGLISVSSAQAARHHTESMRTDVVWHQEWRDLYRAPEGHKPRPPHKYSGRRHHRRSVGRYDAGEILSHPAGCPRTAFCGCGVAVRVFGEPLRDLWLAANWLKFPRTTPHPGAVAVFGHHHVAYIEVSYGDGTAELFDPNSGRHLTRLHRRSIAGATIVQPHHS